MLGASVSSLDALMPWCFGAFPMTRVFLVRGGLVRPGFARCLDALMPSCHQTFNCPYRLDFRRRRIRASVHLPRGRVRPPLDLVPEALAGSRRPLDRPSPPPSGWQA